MSHSARARWTALAALAVVAPGRDVVAGSAIEVYEGTERPAELTPILRKLDRFTLKQHGTSVSSERQWLEIGRLPGIQDSAVTSSKIQAKLDDADAKMRSTDYKLAREYLMTALQWIAENPSTAVRIPILDELLTRAYVTFALLETEANNKKAAIEWMIRVKATIPNHASIRTKFGGDAEALYNEAAKQDLKRPSGALTVNVTNPKARIFIDEIERGAGGYFTGTFPARDQAYRIYVEADGVGYRFDRTISADGRASTLDIDWEFERALVATPEWIGLKIPARLKQRQREFLDAVSARISSTTFYVLGLRTGKTQRHLTARVYSKALGFRCSGEILLDDAQEEARMKQFADFLDSCAFSPLVQVWHGEAAREEAPRPPPPRAHSSPSEPSLELAAVLVGSGIGLVLGGTTLVVVDEEPRLLPDQAYRHPAPWGFAMLAVGVVVGGYGTYRLLDAGTPSAPRRSVTLVPNEGGVMATSAWRF